MSVDDNVYKLDLFCSDVEDFLSKCAVVPIIGSVPAALKIGFGLVQSISAGITAIGSLFFCVSETGRSIFTHSLRHVVHGVINILAGILQAIPLLGSLIYGIQWFRQTFEDISGKQQVHSQHHKFFGYKTIIQQNSECTYVHPGDTSEEHEVIVSQNDSMIVCI